MAEHLLDAMKVKYGAVAESALSSHHEGVESGSDLNAYAKVENQSGCCSPAMECDEARSCCSPAAGSGSLHGELSSLLSAYDINEAAASVTVYAVKPTGSTVPCCGPACCTTVSSRV